MSSGSDVLLFDRMLHREHSFVDQRVGDDSIYRDFEDLFFTLMLIHADAIYFHKTADLLFFIILTD